MFPSSWGPGQSYQSDQVPYFIILLWPITAEVHNTMNQSELEENMWNLNQARVYKACQQDAISFKFTSNWLRKRRGRDFLTKHTQERNKEKTHQMQIENKLKHT